MPTAGTLDEHLDAVGQVFDKLIEAGFAVRCDKVHLAMSEVMYLGFLVGVNGTRPHPSKTQALLDMAVEDMGTDPSAAARYAGMLGFYSKFIPNLHVSLAPFHELKAKGANAREIMSTLRFKAAFAHTKNQLANATALSRPDYTKPFYVDVDAASSTGTGAVLAQLEDVNDPESLRPIAFWSRRFTSEERRYGVRDQECLGLVEAVEAWRQYVAAGRIVVRTDHRSLEFLLTTNHRDHSRVAGLALKLQGYDVTITYVPGPTHHSGDCMSRNIPPLPPNSSDEKGERGKPPAIDLTERAPIDERVNDAIGFAAETRIDIAADRGVNEAIVFAAKAFTVASITTTAGASAELDSSAISDVISAAPTRIPVRHSRRVAAFILRESISGIEILIENQDEHLALPALENVDMQGATGYRGQFTKHMQNTYQYNDTLLHSLAHAVLYRSRRAIPQHFLVVIYPRCNEPLQTRNHTVRATFRPLDLAVLSSLSSWMDRDVASRFAAEFVLRPEVRTQLQGNLTRAQLKNAVAAALHGDDRSRNAHAVLELPRFDNTASDDIHDMRGCIEKGETSELPRLTPDNLCGPAFIDDEPTVRQASTMINNRLAQNPTASVSIDLEGHSMGAGGHVALIQLSIDEGEEGESPLTYVFDVMKCGRVLFGEATPSIRSLLEDSEIVKVLHCCYGDAAALGDEYGIELQGIFDTGVADCLALDRHAGKPRGLGLVLRDWLGATNVQLTYKGTLVHEPGLWYRRPITHRLFTYAYEDVTYCNQLYRRLAAQVKSLGLYELTRALSQQRAPPIALPEHHPRYRPADKFAVALCDKQGSVLCIQDVHTARYSIPEAPFAEPLAPLARRKQAAQAFWESLFGDAAERELHTAVSNRMRKAVRIGDHLLYLAFVKDLTLVLPALAEVFGQKGKRLVVRRRFSIDSPSVGAISSQQLLFQQLSVEASRDGTSRTAISHLHMLNNGENGLHIDTQLRIKQGRVAFTLSTSLRSSGVVSASVAAAKSVDNGPMRVAVILHSDEHVFTICSEKGDPSFPSYGVSGDESLEAVAGLAFDTYAGVSLRKTASIGSVGGHHVMPCASRFVRTAERDAVQLGQFGNTLYFSWKWPNLGPQAEWQREDGSREGNSMIDHLSAYYASRMAVNGFQMVDTKRKAHPGITILTIDEALKKLERMAGDKDRMAAFELKAIKAAKGRAPPQHSEPVIAPAAAVAETGETYVEPQHSDSSQAGLSHGNRWLTEESLPPLGDEPELDTLLVCATAVYAAEAQQRAEREAVAASLYTKQDYVQSREELLEEQLSHPGTAQYIAFLKKRAEREAAAAASANAKQNHIQSRQELLEEQLSHPGTAQYIDFIKLGELADSDVNPVTADKMYLAKDGLLLLREGDGERIVLPPGAQRKVLRLYHDFNGHLGVKKTLELIHRRFYWGTRDEMRKTVSKWIGTCKACMRAKLPHHKLGRLEVLECGDHPNDILSGDVYDVGIVFNGFSHTLDFACHFTRRILSTPVVGMPTSEKIAQVVLDRIISQRGTPREIRSDRASNFISKAMELLYNRLKIRINAGTAYHHQLIGLVERWHQTLKQLILSQKAAGADDNWPSRLSLLELAFNTAVNDSTGYSPFFLDQVRHAVLPMDAMTSRTDYSKESNDDLPASQRFPEWVRQTLETAQVIYDAATRSLRLNALSAKKRFDLRHDVVTTFKAGDRVLLIRGEILDKSPIPKADLPTEGPFTIAYGLSHNRYVLRDLHSRRIHNVVHISRLLPFPERAPLSNQWMISDPQTGGTWPAHSIVGRRVTQKRGVEYKVRWMGFHSDYDKWLQRRYLDTIAPLVSLYDDNNGFALEPTPRAERLGDEPTPPPSTAAQQTARFRHRQHMSEHAPAAEPPVEQPPKPDGSELAHPLEPLTHDPQPIATEDATTVDVSDRFPVGTRVDVHYPREKRSWTGNVIHSFVYRPRTAGQQPERRIHVDYGGNFGVFEHGLNGSDIRKHGERSKRLDKAKENAPPLNETIRKRIARIARQLA